MTAAQTPTPAVLAAAPAAGVGPIVGYLTEERRRVHIDREVLLRQQVQLRQDHIEGWRAESLGREIHDAETVERWLDRQIHSFEVASC